MKIQSYIAILFGVIICFVAFQASTSAQTPDPFYFLPTPTNVSSVPTQTPNPFDFLPAPTVTNVSTVPGQPTSPPASGQPSSNSSFTIPNPLKVNTIMELLNSIALFLLGLVLAIGVIVLIWAGFLYVTAAGDKEKLETAKKAIVWAIIGIILALVANGLVLVIKDVLSGSSSTPSTSSTPITPGSPPQGIGGGAPPAVTPTQKLGCFGPDGVYDGSPCWTLDRQSDCNGVCGVSHGFQTGATCQVIPSSSCPNP